MPTLRGRIGIPTVPGVFVQATSNARAPSPNIQSEYSVQVSSTQSKHPIRALSPRHQTSKHLYCSHVQAALSLSRPRGTRQQTLKFQRPNELIKILKSLQSQTVIALSHIWMNLFNTVFSSFIWHALHWGSWARDAQTPTRRDGLLELRRWRVRAGCFRVQVGESKVLQV